MARERRWMTRWQCILRGHDLPQADAYGEELADGHIEELHYCRRCGAAVWVSGEPHAGTFPEPETAHQLPDMVAPMAPPGSRQHISP